MYKISFDNDKVSISLSSTVLVLYFQKNLAAGQVLSRGPRLTTRDSRPKKRTVAHATAFFYVNSFTTLIYSWAWKGK